MHVFTSLCLTVVLWATMPGLTSAQQMPALPPNQLVFDSTTHTLRFQWLGDSLQTPFEPHAAMLIPIQLENCPKRFYMQFDLGAPASMFYTDKIRQIREKYPTTIPATDTTTLTNIRFRLSTLDVLAKEIKLFTHHKSPISWQDKNSITIIGTMGADLIEGRIIVIDYPAGKLTIGTEVPAKLKSRLTLTDMTFAHRRILLPAQLQAKNIMVIFDTGSSAYELLTDRETATTLASDTVVQRNEVNSWNRKLTANTLHTSNTIGLAAAALPLKHVTYMEGVSSAQVSQMKRMGISGMIGNKIFLNSILVLDTRNRKFGVIKK